MISKDAIQVQGTAMRTWALCALLVISSLHALEEPPEFGDTAVSMSRGEEKTLGAEVFTQIRQMLPLWDDYLVLDYVENIGARLATGVKGHYDFKFFVVSEPIINAFALPGGWIGIYTGMITLAHNESELAAVMAHEMAHVTQRHIAQMYEHAAKVQLGSIAGLIASAVIGAYNAEAGQGALAATMAAGEQSMIHFTRDNERDADRVGLQIMANAGFDPKGMATIFTRMGEAQKYYGNHIPPFLLTHPLSEDRTRDALARAKLIPYRPQTTDDTFKLIKARIKALAAKTPYDALRAFAPGSTDPSELYGLALAYYRANEPKKAYALLDRLPADWSMKPSIILARTDLLLLENQDSKAKLLLEDQLKKFPFNRALVYAYVNLLVTHKQYQQAFDALTRLGERYPNDPMRLYWAARCAANLKDPVQAVIYEVDYYIVQCEYRHAQERIEYAQKRYTDKRSQKLLHTKLEQVKELREHNPKL